MAVNEGSGLKRFVGDFDRNQLVNSAGVGDLDRKFGFPDLSTGPEAVQQHQNGPQVPPLKGRLKVINSEQHRTCSLRRQCTVIKCTVA